MPNYRNPTITDYVYAAKINFDGKNYLVGMMCHEDHTGHLFHDHELTEIKKLAALSSESGDTSDKSEVGQSRAQRASIMSMIHGALEVKPQNETSRLAPNEKSIKEQVSVNQENKIYSVEALDLEDINKNEPERKYVGASP